MHSRARAWYGRRTWHWRDRPAEVLLEGKRRAGARISVVIPARDQERTIGSTSTEGGRVTELVARPLPSLSSEGADSGSAAGQRPLRLGGQSFGPYQRLVMAIVNRTPDSFYDRGATWDEAVAMERVHTVVSEGADIVDIGGVPAAPGAEVTIEEEIRRTVPFVTAVRAAYPDLVISVDTYRHQTARELCAAGADLLNDTWGGWDERLPEVAAACGAGLVCSHAGGLPPRTRPHRVEYDDVMADVLERTLTLAGRAVSRGVDPSRVLIDPAHDFGKNTWQSLEVTRRLGEMVATGWPVLVSLSHKDFIGETLDAGREERLTGTLAATAVCAWLGARVFRAHQVRQTRQVLDMVSAIRGAHSMPRTSALSFFLRKSIRYASS